MARPGAVGRINTSRHVAGRTPVALSLQPIGAVSARRLPTCRPESFPPSPVAAPTRASGVQPVDDSSVACVTAECIVATFPTWRDILLLLPGARRRRLPSAPATRSFAFRTDQHGTVSWLVVVKPGAWGIAAGHGVTWCRRRRVLCRAVHRILPAGSIVIRRGSFVLPPPAALVRAFFYRRVILTPSIRAFCSSAGDWCVTPSQVPIRSKQGRRGHIRDDARQLLFPSLAGRCRNMPFQPPYLRAKSVGIVKMYVAAVISRHC